MFVNNTTHYPTSIMIDTSQHLASAATASFPHFVTNNVEYRQEANSSQANDESSSSSSPSEESKHDDESEDEDDDVAVEQQRPDQRIEMLLNEMRSDGGSVGGAPEEVQ